MGNHISKQGVYCPGTLHTVANHCDCNNIIIIWGQSCKRALNEESNTLDVTALRPTKKIIFVVFVVSVLLPVLVYQACKYRAVKRRGRLVGVEAQGGKRFADGDCGKAMTGGRMSGVR